MALCLAGEEHGGTSDKLTGFLGIISLSPFYFVPSTSVYSHFSSHTHSNTHPSSSHQALQQTVTAVVAGHSGEDGLNPLDTPSDLALLNHTQEVTANPYTH